MALEVKKQQLASSSSWSFWNMKCLQIIPSRLSSSSSSSSKDQQQQQQRDGKVLSDSDTKQRKPGGWKAMPFILGNETFERMESFGLLANFMVYLTRELHMDQVSAANILNLWSDVSNFAPLLGAFISDSYVGRSRTIALGSFALSFLNYLL